MSTFVFEAEDGPAGVVRSSLVARGLVLAGHPVDALRLGFARLAIPGGVTLLQFRPGENPMLGLQLDPAVTGEDELGVHATTPLGPGLGARLGALLPAEGAALLMAALGAFVAEDVPVEVKGRGAELRVLRIALAGSGPFVAPGVAVTLHEALYFTLRHGRAG
ncbi:hypothetical protein [Plastoroseomonas arctica]|uniref:Uncharacterized protein n=1 Tax=Plastoroseomonas arctica TaxID=1509237 RepID=A0AAF1JZZ6_9PROT|nr:hypothetical protein [Plastoroseomonas arctica]MBR0656258.1 hypothetical protein [Plastoroseomonas arctica]